VKAGNGAFERRRRRQGHDPGLEFRAQIGADRERDPLGARPVEHRVPDPRPLPEVHMFTNRLRQAQRQEGFDHQREPPRVAPVVESGKVSARDGWIRTGT
jgi:hypothetical protein